MIRAAKWSLQELERKYNVALEKTAMLEGEVVTKNALAEDVQRLKDELRGKGTLLVFFFSIGFTSRDTQQLTNGWLAFIPPVKLLCSQMQMWNWQWWSRIRLQTHRLQAWAHTQAAHRRLQGATTTGRHWLEAMRPCPRSEPVWPRTAEHVLHPHAL